MNMLNQLHCLTSSCSLTTSAQHQGFFIIKSVRNEGYRMKTSAYTMSYTYQNPSDSPMEVWFSVPCDTAGQRITQVKSAPTPNEVHEHPFENTQWYYTLPPQAQIEITIAYTAGDYTSDPDNPTTLADDERTYFLRSTHIIDLTDEIRAEALTIVEAATDVREQARRIFTHLTQKYAYSAAKKRGIHEFRQVRRGDCGEFAFLFVAYCRSLGIPARTNIGTWSIGTMQAHAWAEFFIEGTGWLIADPSMGRVARNPLQIISGVSIRVQDHFGSRDGKRLAFSLDSEPALMPEYVTNHIPQGGEFCMTVNGTQLPWGYDLLDGTVPYLQPIYVHFQSDVRAKTGQELLGSWVGAFATKRSSAVNKRLEQAYNVFSMLFALLGIFFALQLTLGWDMLNDTWDAIITVIFLMAFSGFVVLSLLTRRSIFTYVLLALLLFIISGFFIP
jgi:hypothetical protein